MDEIVLYEADMILTERNRLESVSQIRVERISSTGGMLHFSHSKFYNFTCQAGGRQRPEWAAIFPGQLMMKTA